jgi:hypothetical protein
LAPLLALAFEGIGMDANKLRSHQPYAQLHRVMPAGCDQQGREVTRPIPAECCTDLGADTRPAALSMTQHRRTAGRVALALLLAPAMAALVAVAAFIARHMG